MIDRRTDLLITTIVRTVVEGVPPQFFASNLADHPGESRFAARKGLDTKNRSLPQVLVVDDEKVIADSVAMILNRNGFSAVAKYSGAAALQSIQEQCPEIVVSDVVMPDFNGIELAKAVRVTCPDARIVLFSGNVDTSSLLDDASIEGYFFEILAKPIHPVQLLKALKS